jgi:pyruvate dehydrogenase E2 component (dihydrolipoamide acetyltransferase)
MINEGRRAALGFRFWDDANDAPASSARGKSDMSEIQAIVMPKWGLVMEEGMLARWSVDEGAKIAVGDEIMDIETSKIANAFESLVEGVLRRKVVGEGETVPVGALLGVVADATTPDTDIDAFVADFLANFKVAAKSGESGPTPEIIEAGGRRIRHLKAGPEEGTPIVFVHGFGGDYLSWAFNQGALAESRRTFALDLPGHGGSTKEVGGGTAAELAEALSDYLDAIGTGPVHVVAHSLGGAVAMEVALRSPGKIAAMSLIAPAGVGPEINGAFIAGYINESRARKLRPVLEMLVADPAIITAAFVEETLKFKRLDGVIPALQTIAAAAFEGDVQRITLRPRLNDIAVPVQVIWGEVDQVLPARQSEGLPPSIGVTRIAQAGHIPHLEKAGEVNALIKAFA